MGYEPAVEFVEHGEVVGYGMSHPRGGTLLTLRLDPMRMAQTVGAVYFEMGVPNKAALDDLAGHLDDVGEKHGPVVETPVGWVLPGLRDPDGHEVRFYVDDPHQGPPTSSRPVRMYDAGTNQARLQEVNQIDLG